jgi:hypothetical protein
MSVVVRATRAFTAYHGPTCQMLTVAEGDQYEGDLAVYLATTGTPVEVVEDPDGAVDAVLNPPLPAPAEEPTPAADGAEPDDPADEQPADSPEPVLGDPDPAADSADDPAADFDPGQHTVAEVIAYAKANPDQAAAVLAAEKAGRARTTILSELA